jgi:lactoylglutathione lyase
MDNTGGMQYISTRLLVDDFAACFRFYRDVMGFKPTYGKEDDVYAYFDTGATAIELFIRQYMDQVAGRATAPITADTPDRAMMSFKVDNVDESYNQLKGRGATMVTEPTDRSDWGVRAAHFRDPAGNLLEIFQSLPTSEAAQSAAV